MRHRARIVVKPVLAIFLALEILAINGEPSAFADGFFAKHRLYKKLPGIPSQRALLSYKDGVEQLMIESALDGEGQSFCWIIPVPARPTAFEKGSRGLLMTLFLNLQPEIIETGRDKTFRSARGGGPSQGLGIEVEDTVTVGSYDLGVLNAANALALNTWLAENDYSELPDHGVAIVADYVAEGWRFVAAKLRREGDGFSRPHPLSMTFPCDRPVYPMRLTALADSDVYLELFVVADQRAAHQRLELEFCDTFGSKYWAPFGTRSVLGPPESPRGMGGRHSWVNVGHPETKEYLWEDCVVTKLTGRLRPDEMGADFVLAFEPPEPYRRKIVVDVNAPNADVVSYSHYAQAIHVLVEQAKAVTRVHDRFSCWKREEALGVLRDHFTYTILHNAITRERLAFEDLPGGLVLLEDERGIVCRTYGVNGAPEDHVVCKAGYEAKAPSADKSLDEWLDQLKGDDPMLRLEATRHLVHHPDTRAVGPMIGMLGDPSLDWKVEDYVHHPLEYTTGLDLAEHGPREEKYRRWSAWWKGHEDEPRKKWLRDALAHPEGILPITIAYLLTQSGDDSMADLLVEELPRTQVPRGPDFWPPYRNQLLVAEVLARVGREEGFACLRKFTYPDQAEGVLLNVATPQAIECLLDSWSRKPHVFRDGPPVRALYTCARDPERLFPVVLGHLKKLRAEGNDNIGLHEFEVSVLGLTTKTVPPLDVQDKEKVDAFLAKAGAWYASHGGAGGALGR